MAHALQGYTCYPLWDPFAGQIFRCQHPITKKTCVIPKDIFQQLEAEGIVKLVNRYTEKPMGRNGS